ncbi:MAG: amidohydrolase [Lachnospiraceae bacterium]|nr:amidohydrolase [Lachnospiraceae bacterium]
MKVRIYNGRILTMVVGEDIFMGELWIEADTICKVISYEDTAVCADEKRKQEIVWDQEIDAKGNLILPGFKNAHTHSPMTFLRSYADDMSLQRWLNTCVFPAEAKLTDEDVYWLARLAILEYLTSGMTTVFDMYFKVPSGAKAFLDSGFRNVICGNMNDHIGSLEQMEAEFLRYNQDENVMLSYQLGFHAEYTTREETLKEIVALSHKYKSPLYTHCAETAYEVADCRKRTGMTPVAYLDRLGAFAYGGGLFHGVHPEEADFDIIKKRGLYVITNPASNLKLASGIAPIQAYIEKEIPLAIGTDGPASNNGLDMFREMYLVTALQKGIHGDPAAVPAMEVLKMAIVTGAHGIGLPVCDSLAVGKKADLIMLDLQQPNMQPLQNIAKNVVYSGSKSNVKMTMIAGKIRYRDGTFDVGVDAEKIYAKANQIAQRILR